MDPVETVIEMISNLTLSEAEDMDWEPTYSESYIDMEYDGVTTIEQYITVFNANQGTKRKAEDEHPEQPPAKRQR